MAKKSSTVIKGINKKPTKPRGVKTEKPLGITSKEKQAKGMPIVAASKPTIKKHTKKQTISKSFSIEQELTQRNFELQIINSIQQGLAAELDFQGIIDPLSLQLRTWRTVYDYITTTNTRRNI